MRIKLTYATAVDHLVELVEERLVETADYFVKQARREGWGVSDGTVKAWIRRAAAEGRIVTVHHRSPRGWGWANTPLWVKSLAYARGNP